MSLINAKVLGQALAQSYHDDYKPVSILPEGLGFDRNITTLHNLRGGGDYRYVSVVLSANEAVKGLSTTLTGGTLLLNNSIELALGRAAAIPVQRNIRRVRDGDVGLLQAYYRCNYFAKKSSYLLSSSIKRAKR